MKITIFLALLLFVLNILSYSAQSRGTAPQNRPSDEAASAHEEERINYGRAYRIDLPGRNRVLFYGKTSIYYFKKKVSELKENAYVKSRDFEVYAHRILYFERYLKRERIDGEREEHAQAWGNVVIIDRKEKVKISGAAAFYYPARKYMRITGGAKMVNSKEGVVITGQTMERYTKQNVLIVTGYVYILKPKDGLKILAGRMRYNTKTRDMVLTGNVRIWETKKEKLRYVSGDRVEIRRDDRKRTEHMVVKGNAYLEEKNKGKLIRKANSEKMDYYSVKNSKDKAVVEKIILSGHAYIVTEKQKIRALKVVVDKDLTKKKEVWELFDNVFIKDLKTEDEIRGGYVNYNKSDEVIRVTKNPSFYVFKEKAYIYSDVMTSYRRKKLSVFVGDVEIIQEEQRIYGENALFNEELKKIVITGEPLIINKDNITYADRVTFLTDKKEVRLSSRFRGVLMPEDEPNRSRQRVNNRRGQDGIQIGDIGGPEIL